MWKKTAFVTITVVSVFVGVRGAEQISTENTRSAAKKKMAAGNYREAHQDFHKIALDVENDPKRVGGDLKDAVTCLRNLNRTDEVDDFREQVIAAHQQNWRLLLAAAETLIHQNHSGFIVAGEFRRGNRRGGGKYVNSFARDRVRALQLMQQALPLVAENAQPHEASNFYLSFSRFLLSGRGYQDAWQLQALTDLVELPDYEEGYHYFRGSYGGNARGAPVDAEGNPVFHRVPASYEAAQTDGQRRRWMLSEVVRTSPDRKDEVLLHRANFLRGQFGVQTLRQYGRFFGRPQLDDDGKDESGPYALHTLGEDETIARLANGIKRFKLPDEFNFIRLFQKVGEGGKPGLGQAALNTLAQISEDRRQYSRAADYWRESIRRFGPGNKRYKEKRLKQITGNWGRFENATVQAAGKGATVEFRYRNGKKVEFTAHRLKIDTLLADVKAYLKSNPGRLRREQVNLANIGHRIVTRNQQKYVGKRVAEWTVNLKPRKAHFDSRITATTPLKEAGAYLLVGKMAGGNTSRIIIWLDDTLIVKKQLNGRAFYFVADAVSGKPIERANLEFFGYKQKRVARNRYTVLISNFAEFTDADGQVFPDPKDLRDDHQWVVVARTNDGRLAHLGFRRVWYSRSYDREYNQNKVFVTTDRPVYRPSQPVKFKFWIRNAKYDQENVSNFAHQSFQVRVTSPKNETVFEKQFKSDAYGGFAGEFELAEEATLGHYSIQLVHGRGVSGGGHFRVEEYKKPEFEVTVEAPKEPVMLGEKIVATVNAKYYFGAPVVNAKVHYKVTRTNHTSRWYPVGRWDWFYGSGYWWYAYDYVWYPGWKSWGCVRPNPFWWPQRHDPPEVVLDNLVTIGEDGKVEIEIDTSLAKEVHGDLDHRYEITAEVVDQSRRTIVGKGQVLVARKPFKVFAWLGRGYYRAGDVVKASFKAQTLDQKPVEGKGAITLYRVTYNEKAEPTETEVEQWKLDTNDRGEAELQFKAARAGQYRLSYKVTDKKEHTIEGGYVFTVTGEAFDGNEYRFNDIELVTDKREYKPGEKVRVMINTNRVGSTVVLFVRAANGVYPRPQILRLDGKSTLHEVAVVKKDMPNFFIEAFTISGGKIFSETREVIVPPEKRVVKIEVLPSSDEYKPGAPAKIKFKLTDLFGKPFTGSTVVSIYDKSVEYISGGSNVPEIRSFFWKWRRSHHPRTESSLQRHFGNLLRRGETRMNNLGAFGHLVNEIERFKKGDARPRARGRHHGHFGPEAKSSRFADDGAAPAGAPMEIAEGIQAGGAGGGAPLVEPSLRTQFADTAFWAAALTPDKDGIAEIALTMPENLTTWKIRAWTMGHGTTVGEGEAEVITTKNVIIRMQSPRFFTEKDEVLLSANVHNYLETPKTARVVLELDGETLVPLDSLEQSVEIPAEGEARINWRVKANLPGEAVVRMKVLTDEESDAMEMRFPVYVHGMLKTESFTGVIRPDRESASIELNVPAARRSIDTTLEVRYSPTLAGALVDALPYLVSYPHRTTDTTLTRFLPTVLTQNILKRMNLDLKAIREKRTNLNPQEIGDDRLRATGWKRYPHNPVFDEAEVNRMVKKGLKALTEMQLSDGGWGWFSGWGERSDAHTTALTVHGLQVAQENGVALVPGLLEGGVNWLKRYQAEQIRRLKHGELDKKKRPYKLHADNIDAFVFMVLADADVVEQAMLDYLYRDRTKLSVYAKGMYGLALHTLKENEKLAMIVRNIDQFLVQDDENQTAYLKLPGTYWWYWYGSETEANAYYLKLLSRTEPNGEKASRLVKYLLNNRKHATYWNSTRDTAIAVEAMAEYLKASGEDRPEMTVEIYFDGQKQQEVHINAENLFRFDNSFVLVGDAVSSGAHTVELRRKGGGPLYYNAYLRNFTLEDFITRAGLEIKVNRKFYKLHRKDKKTDVPGSRGQVVGLRVEKYERKEIKNLSTITSGDLVEIELEIDSKNDYEYLIFEDMKVAGFEPVKVQSGYDFTSLPAYVEYRDERVTFFVRRLARGKHSVSYRLRAEIPGSYSALPTKARAMYAPELRGNSDEFKVSIVD